MAFSPSASSLSPPPSRGGAAAGAAAPSPAVMLGARIVGDLCLTISVVSLVLFVLPNRFAGRLPKLLRTYRNKLRSIWRRGCELSTQGPFYRSLIWAGRKLGRGYLSSAPRPPAVKAKPHGCEDVEVLLSRRLPWNPFHEENYLIAWSRADEEEPVWRYKEFHSEFDFEASGGRLKTVVEGLPEECSVKVRAAAVNKWGQSEWSKEQSVETMTKPNDGGGSTGPAGLGAPRKTRYTWTQTTTEVHLKLPLNASVKARDIRFKCTGSKLEIRLSEEAVAASGSKHTDLLCGTLFQKAVAASGSKHTDLLCGTLFQKVKTDEVFWTIEEEDSKMGRHLFVQMVKGEAMKKWECMIEGDGHTRIDVRHVRFYTGDFTGFGDLAGLGG